MAEFRRYADITVDAQLSKATQAEATVLTGVAGTFHDLTLICFSASGGTNTVTLKDGTAGTSRLVVTVPANTNIVIPLTLPMATGTAGNNWTVTLSAATNVDILLAAVRRN